MKAKRIQQGINKEHNLAGYLFIAPLMILFAVFLAYSFYFLIQTSFFNVTISFKDPEFAGLQNYKIVLKDWRFLKSLLNTLLLSGANIFIALTLGFLVSIFLGFKFRGVKFFNSLFFIPAMLPVSFIAAVFSSMLEYKEGTVNLFLRAIGLDFLAQQWLSNPNFALFSVMSVSIFLIGIPIMYYTADISTLNTSILEAAVIDGAGLREILCFILYPLLKNSHKTIALSMLLGGFREMERVYLMTDGGPGGATEIIGTYIYRSTRSAGSNLGTVSAAAVIVLIVAFVISFIQIKLSNTTKGE